MDNHTYNKLDDILQAEYKRGYEEGYAARKEADQGDNVDYYKQGLEEAWELAKQIYYLPVDGGFPTEKIENIFGTVNWEDVLRNLTAQETIEKIKEYEAEQKRKEEEEKKLVHVGDEVTDVYDKTGFVTKVDGKYLSILYLDGSVGYGDKSCFDLTGRRAEGLIVGLKHMKMDLEAEKNIKQKQDKRKCDLNENCRYYEIGEGGCAICAYDGEAIDNEKTCPLY